MNLEMRQFHDGVTLVLLARLQSCFRNPAPSTARYSFIQDLQHLSWSPTEEHEATNWQNSQGPLKMKISLGALMEER